MLCLSRKLNEKIVIDDGKIIVEIYEIRGSIIRLGVTAPKNVSIHREEVWLAIQKEKGESCE
jgi:carbon storage regulator